MPKPQSLHLDPSIDAANEPITSDKSIGLQVVDNRPSKKLGEVGDPNKGMFDVVLDEDFTAQVREAMKEVLESRGFDVVPEGGATKRSLTVAISDLELSSVKRPLDFETNLKANVFVTADNVDATYDREYFVVTRKTSAAPPREQQSNQLVNDAVSQALSDMASDEDLFEMLLRWVA